MNLAQCVETFNLLGDESRIRLCALLRERELCVTDLVRVTGMAQSRVSTHLGRLREAGFVRDRRKGAAVLLCPGRRRPAGDGPGGPATRPPTRPTPPSRGTSGACSELEAERRGGLPDSADDELERYYSPGRTWQSLATGVAALLRLGDVLDVGSGDGAAAAVARPLLPLAHLRRRQPAA